MKLGGASEKPDAIGFAAPDADSPSTTSFIRDHWFHGNIAPKPDGDARTEEAVDVADQFLPGRAELNLVDLTISGFLLYAGKEPQRSALATSPFY